MKKISLSDALVYDQKRKLWNKAEKRKEIVHAFWVFLFTASVTLSILWGIVYA